jgi:hypothetical protein
MLRKKAKKYFRFGQALLKENLIDEKQLELALAYQDKAHRRMKNKEIAPLGEVVVHLFNVSLERIEEVFFRYYLIDMIRDALLDLIMNDRRLQKLEIDYDAFLDDISIRLISYQRLKAESVFLKEEEGRIVFDYSECWDYKIQGTTKATITATNGRYVSHNINFTYVIYKKMMTLEGDLGLIGLRMPIKALYMNFKNSSNG